MRLFKLKNRMEEEFWHDHFLWFPTVVRTGTYDYEVRWLETVKRKATYSYVGMGDYDKTWNYELKELNQ